MSGTVLTHACVCGVSCDLWPVLCADLLSSQKGPVYNGICDAGANWDNMSFNPTNTNDADCKVDPDFHFLDNVDKKVSTLLFMTSGISCCRKAGGGHGGSEEARVVYRRDY